MLLRSMLQECELKGCEARPTKLLAANGRQRREIWSRQNYSTAQDPTGMMHGPHCKRRLAMGIGKMLTFLGK